jgi:hypothetical protein
VRSHAKAATAGSTQRQARRLVLPFAVLAALAALMVAAFPASAVITHPFKETFGSSAQPSFSGAQGGIAVDQSGGDVLVIDAGTIKRFNPDGTPANFAALGSNVIDGQGAGDETPQNGLSFSSPAESQIAVDNSGTATDGDIYVTQTFPNVINVFSEAGEYLGQLSESSGGPFSEVCGVAVDPSGAVYVGGYEGGIHKFVPAANPPVNGDYTTTFSSTTNPCTLAAGAGPSAGFLFVARFNGPISKIDSGTGELKYVVAEGSNTTLSADPNGGNVFVATNESIREFDASGAASATSVSSLALASQARGVAVRGSSGEVYVSRAGSSNLEVFGPLVTLPVVTTDSASNIGETTATLNGAVNPDGVELTECSFEYGTTTSYGQSAPCAQSPAAIGSGTSPVPVSADISGLAAGTAYHFRLVAKNPNGMVNGDDEIVQTTGPTIADAWTASVVRTEATIRARINPRGAATTYRFEWGLDSSYGSSTAEFPVGSDEALHAVTRTLTGLQPDTTYHWRVVATNPSGVTVGADGTFTTYAPAELDTACPNQTFRTGPSAKLPDCRAYEMVSPIAKNGGEIARAFNGGAPGAGFFQAALSGEKLAYTSPTAFGDQPSSQSANQYIATRGAQGWSSDGINPFLTASTIPFAFVSPFALHREYMAFSEDLSSGWFQNDNSVPLVPEGVVGFANLYRRDNESGSLEAITLNAPSTYYEDGGFEDLALHLELKGASADDRQSVYQATGALTPDAAAMDRLQVYTYAEGEVHLVSVLPDGTANPRESVVGTHVFDLGHPDYQDTVDRAVSEDGSRIFWSGFSKPSGNPRIYLRENPTQPQSALSGGVCTEPDKACTIPVSESVSPDESRSEFLTASTDGSKAVFMVHGVGQHSLYEFDVDTETSTLIADSVGGAEGAARVAGASEDLSYLYFISSEALAAGASAGKPNLYLDHEGTVSLIATLSPTDATTALVRGPDPAASSPLDRYSRVTPDGRHLVFMSSKSLTGYDNTDVAGASSISLNGDADFEVFLYDAEADRLTCVSCNPSGARPIGKPQVQPFATTDTEDTFAHPAGLRQFWTAAWIPTWENEFHPSRVISEDGSRLFFNSFDALVPEDTNGDQDVYQWEEQGTGGCEKAEGCVSLISTGQSPEKSEFIDASADGDDVFIRTKSSIDPDDPGLYDLYDARVGGGHPTPLEPPPCIGDACQDIPAAPSDPTPASAGFRGAGSPPAKKPRRRCTSNRKRKAAKSKASARQKQKAKRCKRAKRGAGR